jgi:hypothetical protein
MKAQVSAEISAIIVGAIFMWIGTVFLGAPTSGGLASSFTAYVGWGFILAGVVSIAGGILSLVRR